MSSSLCQGLQSCLEPRLVEPHILMHILAPQKPNLEGLSFIQALTNTSHNKKQGNETEQVYVHSHVNRSSSILSTKSLEMCTESLGSETGSDNTESIDEFASMVMEKQNNDGLQLSKSREFTKKVNRTVKFPPPLTSISGSDGVQFRPHREDGRLVLKAVTVSSCNSCFQAERAGGRLRLSFLKESHLNFDKENVCTEDSEVVTGHEYADKVDEEYYDEEDDNDGDDGSEDDANGGSRADDMKGNGAKVGDFPRPSRCKEGGNGNKGMQNWGTFCMAIS